jgi:hypothetical protein
MLGTHDSMSSDVAYSELPLDRRMGEDLALANTTDDDASRRLRGSMETGWAFPRSRRHRKSTANAPNTNWRRRSSVSGTFDFNDTTSLLTHSISHYKLLLPIFETSNRPSSFGWRFRLR